ncbi:hypothetical protein [Zavarzinia compransoris]|uniref:Uncharacterized protein n=1 Tax=Zavarzinia compransoris TaxID=1264899 RepID=A0A317DTN4_9PROT|nr:hypothetical protein [Zavarzinia compransoris]PWR17722.1 hypothetical protein DKG75_21475 [Zavarzinia compransoris]TDP49245.1 hypothetical protein DES42_101615 [Zavarzinia compransoris]
MLMTLLVAVGFALLAAFLARAMLPAPWNRYVFLLLGVPALGLTAVGFGLTIYAYATCDETVAVAHPNADGTPFMTISSLDCGDPANRSFDVTITQALNGKRVDTTILRSHGLPAPADVAEIEAGEAGGRRFRVTMTDGTSHETGLLGPKAEPDTVWSILNGEVQAFSR